MFPSKVICEVRSALQRSRPLPIQEKRGCSALLLRGFEVWDFRILKHKIIQISNSVSEGLFHSQLSSQGPRKSVDLVYFITLSILYT